MYSKIKFTIDYVDAEDKLSPYVFITGTLEDGEADPIDFKVLDGCVDLQTEDYSWVTIDHFTCMVMGYVADLDRSLEEWLWSAARSEEDIRDRINRRRRSLTKLFQHIEIETIRSTTQES